MSTALLTAGALMEHDHARPPLRPASALMRQLSSAGTIARLDLLDRAMESARRQGAADALAAATADPDGWAWLTPADREALETWLLERARLHLAGEL